MHLERKADPNYRHIAKRAIPISTHTYTYPFYVAMDVYFSRICSTALRSSPPRPLYERLCNHVFIWFENMAVLYN